MASLKAIEDRLTRIANLPWQTSDSKDTLHLLDHDVPWLIATVKQLVEWTSHDMDCPNRNMADDLTKPDDPACRKCAARELVG